MRLSALVAALLLSTILASSTASPSSHLRNRWRLVPAEETTPLLHGALSAHAQPPPPQTFFEVRLPIQHPRSQPCSLPILQHSFAFTYGLPPAMANYTPPAHCGNDWSQIVLEWSGACKGRQFDRIAAVWLSGVEILRTCTAEPTQKGIVWQVEKDVTRYSSLFKEPQLVVLELNNIVDSTYTGIFHINLTFHFYKAHRHKSEDLAAEPAHLVLPVSLPSPLPGGYWFQLNGENETASKSLKIPQNAYKAVLEIYVSFHGDDEFWYSNPPNEYIVANNLSGLPGNGAFREVQALVDGKLVGAFWPFPVIYTGGIDFLYWRPAAAIGAFDLPSYEVELTPCLGWLLDGKSHSFSLRVKDALSFWPIDANLHLWLDHNSEQTMGGLLTYDVPPYTPKVSSEFKGLDGIFHIHAERSFSFSGYVVSSMGKVVTSASYSFKFSNVLVFENETNIQIVTQATESKREVITKKASEVVFSQLASSSFPFYWYCLQYEGFNKSITQRSNLTHAFNQETSIVSPKSGFFSSAKNSQHAQGELTFTNKNLLVSASGALQQRYDFESTKGCYGRSLSTYNYSILSDASGTDCINYS